MKTWFAWTLQTFILLSCLIVILDHTTLCNRLGILRRSEVGPEPYDAFSSAADHTTLLTGRGSYDSFILMCRNADITTFQSLLEHSRTFLIIREPFRSFENVIEPSTADHSRMPTHLLESSGRNPADASSSHAPSDHLFIHVHAPRSGSLPFKVIKKDVVAPCHTRNKCWLQHFLGMYKRQRANPFP